MEMLNQMQDFIKNKKEYNLKKYLKVYIQPLAPFAPHLAEELWELIGEEFSVFNTHIPNYDPELINDDEIQVVIRVNGKVRSKIMVDANISKEELEKLALNDERIKKWIENKNIIKTIVVPRKLVNIVVK